METPDNGYSLLFNGNPYPFNGNSSPFMETIFFAKMKGKPFIQFFLCDAKT
jgi:hypothetical protein